MNHKVSFRSNKRASSWRAKRRMARIRKVFQRLTAWRYRFAPVAAVIESHVALVILAFCSGLLNTSSVPLYLPLLLFVVFAGTQRFLYQIIFALFFSTGADAIVGLQTGSSFLLFFLFLIVYHLSIPKVSKSTSADLLRPILAGSFSVCTFDLFHQGFFNFVLPSGFDVLQGCLTFLFIFSIFSLRFLFQEIFRTQQVTNRDGAVSLSGAHAFS